MGGCGVYPAPVRPQELKKGHNRRLMDFEEENASVSEQEVPIGGKTELGFRN
jgi:hypothetical protein